MTSAKAGKAVTARPYGEGAHGQGEGAGQPAWYGSTHAAAPCLRGFVGAFGLLVC